jgi:hypothetical protein
VRIVADCTGTCPLCGAVVTIDGNPEHPVAWAVLPVTLSVPHVPGCPAVFADSEAAWFDPEAWTP